MLSEGLFDLIIMWKVSRKLLIWEGWLGVGDENI